jgi:DnaJ-class molecular chaperone
MEPVFIQAFNTKKEVECGCCKGTGLFDNGYGFDTCPLCKGKGKLIDIRTGVIRLYTLNYDENQV